MRILNTAAQVQCVNTRRLFNVSLKLGKMPSDVKSPKGSSILTNESKFDSQNYGLIIYKISYQPIHNQVYEFTVNYNMKCYDQSAFLKHHSTQTSSSNTLIMHFRITYFMI